MGAAPRILLRSTEELWHLFRAAWGGRDPKTGELEAGLVTQCGLNDLTLKIVGVNPLPKYSTRCVGCFGHGV